jgi:hypothetical protein
MFMTRPIDCLSCARSDPTGNIRQKEIVNGFDAGQTSRATQGVARHQGPNFITTHQPAVTCTLITYVNSRNQTPPVPIPALHIAESPALPRCPIPVQVQILDDTHIIHGPPPHATERTSVKPVWLRHTRILSESRQRTEVHSPFAKFLSFALMRQSLERNTLRKLVTRLVSISHCFVCV